jgi:hypothetical protein
VIVFALLVGKKIKQESHQRIFFLAVVCPADKDAMEVILLLLGTISTKLVSSLVIFTRIPNGAAHMPSLLVITTLMENMDPVDLLNQPLSALNHA